MASTPMQDASALSKELQTIARPMYAFSVLIESQGCFILFVYFTDAIPDQHVGLPSGRS